MPKLRSTLFWVHLALGVTTGAVAALMAGTGVVLAFADMALDLRERGARTVEIAAGAAPRPLDALRRVLAEERPGLRVNRVTIDRDPHAAYEFYSDPDRLDYLDPYTGEIRPSELVALRGRLIHGMEQWHRFFGLSGDRKQTGKWFASWFNVAFVPLLLSGLWIWLPPVRRWRVVRRGLTPIPGGRGRGTLRSWHLAVGFWVAPLLLLMVLTATPTSFNRVDELAHRLGPASAATPRSSMWPPAQPERALLPDRELLGLEGLRRIAERELPDWSTLEIRPARADAEGGTVGVARVVVSSPTAGPGFFPVTLQLDPYTGEVLDRHGWSRLSSGTRWLAWARWLHKGEAFGRTGQVILGLACVAMIGLVGSGWLLALRRLRRRLRRANA